MFSPIAVVLGCASEPEDMPLTDENNLPKTVTVRYLGGEHDSKWKEDSKALVNPKVEIYFLLSDGSNFHDEHSASFLLPDIPRKFKNKISTSEVFGSEQKLVDYYNQIATAARQKKIGFSTISHLFWLRLIIHDLDGNEIFNFSYCDTLDEIVLFQEWVDRNNEQEEFSNMDQGWAIEAAIRKENVYLLESDPDHGSYSVNRYISHEYLNSAMKDTLQAAREIIKILSESMGEDVWSRYRGYPWDSVEF